MWFFFFFFNPALDGSLFKHVVSLTFVFVRQLEISQRRPRKFQSESLSAGQSVTGPVSIQKEAAATPSVWL